MAISCDGRRGFAVMLARLVWSLGWAAATAAGAADTGFASLPAIRNESAISAVTAGRTNVADAAWWGFDTSDATAALQAAIDSGASRVVVPFTGAPWIVRPIVLRSDLELVFEPGVVVLAKAGEFLGGGDSLF